MNVKNNKRRRESVEKIEKAFVELLQTKELGKISVSEICAITELNRTTFYSNYIDIYDLADKVRGKLEREFTDLFTDYDYMNGRDGVFKMFTHIKENQLFYKTYFKLCYDESHLISVYDPLRAEKEFGTHNVKYHIEFFRNGFNAVIKLWLAGGCVESPEEMANIIKQEYRGR